MNHDHPWEQMVQNVDSSFEEFLADVDVGDFNDIDFTDLEKDAGLLGFDQAEAMGDGGTRGFAAMDGPPAAVDEKRRFGGQPQAFDWNGQAGAGMPPGYMPVDGAMNFQQAQARSMLQHQHHAQYGTIPRPAAVPPTPNSLEMNGKPPNYAMGDNQHARAVYENHTRKQHDQMVFTPLVSPAVTPLDSQFQIPEYTVPGEYFTPLTSPAMQAQPPHQRSVYGSVRGSDTSEAASPSDMEIDTSPAIAHATPSSTSKGKKPAKAKPLPRQVRHSPAMKAQRKKAPTSATIVGKDLVDMMEGIAEPGSRGSSRPGSSSLPLPGAKTSESSSISPEPLSEILMPPPATPRSGSKGRSPNLGPQDSAPSRGANNSPATPATLMRLQNSSTSGRGTQSSPSAPASRATPALLPNLRSLPPSSEGATTPLASASNEGGRSSAPPKTAGLPLSPNTSAQASGSGTPRAIPKGKKRHSSTQPSPALRPRISPSIKPLLPEGSQGISAETSALLLASKSNYQNILEGNHLPGVNYPNTLSANLTSKRTSHKLAEQGRRNRMNFALQELATLLPAIPPSPTVAGKEKGSSASPPLKSGEKGSSSGPGGAAANKDTNSSKASTVEMAIEFIKELQGELGDVRGRLAAAEQALGRPVESMEKSAMSTTVAEQEPVASKNEAMQDAAVQAGSKKGKDR